MNIAGDYIGEIKRGKELGYVSKSSQFIWHACERCNKQRWVRLRRGLPSSRVCRDCRIQNMERYYSLVRGEKHASWKGGRHITSDGYIEILLQPGDFFFPMAGHNNYVLEHRLVMAKHLGRCLLKTEVVHHRPDVGRDDNRIEVLYLMPNPSEHSKLIPCSSCELKKEIRLLRWQIMELQKQLQGELI